MAKVKLTIDTVKVKKFLVAADIADLKVIETMKAGDITVVVLNFKHPSQLFTAGYMLDKVSDSYEKKSITTILEGTDEPDKPGVKK
jgi:hypothetical protein